VRSGNAGGQGGSTLTQQLARELYLSNEKTYRRKITEILLARRLEAQYSKSEILAKKEQERLEKEEKERQKEEKE